LIINVAELEQLALTPSFSRQELNEIAVWLDQGAQKLQPKRAAPFDVFVEGTKQFGSMIKHQVPFYSALTLALASSHRH